MDTIAVIGSAGFGDDNLLGQVLDPILSLRLNDVRLISTTNDASLSVMEYADLNGIPFESITVDEEDGRNAVKIRNTKIAFSASECIVFWDDKDSQVYAIMERCRQFNVPLRVIPVHTRNERYSRITGRELPSTV